MKTEIKDFLKSSGNGEYRLVVNQDTGYIHPLGRDGETLDFKLNDWISVKDQQPKQGYWCMIYSWRGVLMASFWGSHWCLYNHNEPGVRIEISDVSHWQPLPVHPPEPTKEIKQ